MIHCECDFTADTDSIQWHVDDDGHGEWYDCPNCGKVWLWWESYDDYDFGWDELE